MTTPAAPGTQIVSRAAPPSSGGVTSTGVWHIAAIAERGPTDSPRMLYNLADYDRFYGSNRTYTQRDAVEAHFRNKGARINFIRIVGPAATRATVALPGAAAALSLSVDSIGEGPLAMNVAVDIPVAGTFVLRIIENGITISQSPPLTDVASAVLWGQDNPYINVRATGAVIPVATAAGGIAIAGGNDDRAAITDVHRAAAINRIPKGDGPGNVSIPGATTTAAHQAVAQHAELNNRFALLDSMNTAVLTDHTALADADRAAMTFPQEEVSMLLEGWHIIPGALPGTTRTVPPSAVVSALMAFRDDQIGHPNDAAAGINGIPTYSLGISRPNWTDAQRLTLNNAGVNVFRYLKGAQRLYGYRTLVDPNGPSATWLNAGNARLRMAMAAEADELAESYVFGPITKAKIAAYNGAIRGMCLRYYGLGALFGDTPGEAFTVDTGSGVNTPERISTRRLSAVVATRMSEMAEIVYMEFVKVPVTEALA